jgi:hypothetical protein
MGSPGTPLLGLPAFLLAAPSNPGPPVAPPSDDPLPLGFAQTGFPQATIGVPFYSSVQAIGGTGLYSLEVTGDLPPGLVVEIGANTIAVGGTPTQLGEFSLEITIRDASSATLRQTFSIQVGQSIMGSGLLVPASISDAEAFGFNDTGNAFFPVNVAVIEGFSFADQPAGLGTANIVDNEVFHFTDSETGLGAASIVDNEVFHLTDSETGLGAVLIVDNEVFSFTDSEVGLDSVQTLDREPIHFADSVAVTAGWPPSLGLAKSHTGTFTQGSTAQWNIEVTNSSKTY